MNLITVSPLEKSILPLIKRGLIREFRPGGPLWGVYGGIVGVQIIIPPVDRRVDQVPYGCADNNNSDQPVTVIVHEILSARRC